MQAESSELALKLYGEYLFDDIIIFAPKATDFNTITVQDILAFIGDGGNVLLAVNDEVYTSATHTHAHTLNYLLQLFVYLSVMYSCINR